VFVDGGRVQTRGEAFGPGVHDPRWRTCVATMRGSKDFRWMVMAEAKRRHFSAPKRRAFVADGAPTTGRCTPGSSPTPYRSSTSST